VRKHLLRRSRRSAARPSSVQSIGLVAADGGVQRLADFAFLTMRLKLANAQRYNYEENCCHTYSADTLRGRPPTAI